MKVFILSLSREFFSGVYSQRQVSFNGHSLLLLKALIMVVKNLFVSYRDYCKRGADLLLLARTQSLLSTR